MSHKLVDRSLRVVSILTSPLRVMPNFLLIGAQKCGTTSLFHYLLRHPNIGKPLKKEIGFFSVRFYRGINWYKSFFPTPLSELYQEHFITGEASTGYICHPHAPNRIARTIPQVKLIALLRNPVDRAYSHYYHTKRLGREDLAFEEAIAKENERVGWIEEKIREDEYYYHDNYHLYTYLSRGIYINQLKNWLGAFTKKQILVLRSEDLFSNPSAIVNQVFDFLELPNWEIEHYEQCNSNSYQSMIEPATRESLVEFYKTHNESLYKLLGINFDWDR